MAEKKPVFRHDCIGKNRPCLWISCKHHMIWGYSGLKKKSDDEIVELIATIPSTCTLDVADQGGCTLEEVGIILGGLTRERVRQIEDSKDLRHNCRRGALEKLRHPKYLKQFGALEVD